MAGPRLSSNAQSRSLSFERVAAGGVSPTLFQRSASHSTPVRGRTQRSERAIRRSAARSRPSARPCGTQSRRRGFMSRARIASASRLTACRVRRRPQGSLCTPQAHFPGGWSSKNGPCRAKRKGVAARTPVGGAPVSRGCRGRARGLRGWRRGSAGARPAPQPDRPDRVGQVAAVAQERAARPEVRRC
jgi:hypothetical protein